MKRQEGRFTLADRGTIFLDEIGELPLELQAKLLQVLQEGAFEPLGSGATRSVDVRVIAATNRDLEQAVAEGTFRADLFFRLNVFPIELPPLRERPGDIPLLAWAFVRQNEARLGKSIQAISEGVMGQLRAYPWPGNVRELENVVQRAMILSPGESLAAPHFQLGAAVAGSLSDVGLSLEEVERRHITDVLEACDWRVKGPSGAALRLGLPPSTLRHRMAKLGIRKGS